MAKANGTSPNNLNMALERPATGESSVSNDMDRFKTAKIRFEAKIDMLPQMAADAFGRHGVLCLNRLDLRSVWR